MRNLFLSDTALTCWLGAVASLVFAGGPVQAQTAEPIDLPAIVVQGETATSPVHGYVARRSATATKTDTPIIETPQSVSVVTRDQIEAQGARGSARPCATQPAWCPNGVELQAAILALQSAVS